MSGEATTCGIRWEEDALLLLDQRRLPSDEVWVRCTTRSEVALAIRDMVVRGAPAIAIAAAYGYALAAHAGEDLETAAAALVAARPTAVNIRWAIERLRAVPPSAIPAEAAAIHDEDIATNRALGAHGAALLDANVLTICNTGALATGGHGTALGMVRSARSEGRDVRVWALETRPYLQGARLTAWECARDGIPCTLIADGMAGAALARGSIRAVVVGCDRVAANGDTANKIGTYGLSVLARHHGVPFYVAMPTSSLDRACPSGAAIPIEERPAAELTRIAGASIAPPGATAWNPAFDVTPAALVTAWVTERGIWTLPFPPGVDTAGEDR